MNTERKLHQKNKKAEKCLKTKFPYSKPEPTAEATKKEVRDAVKNSIRT